MIGKGHREATVSGPAGKAPQALGVAHGKGTLKRDSADILRKQQRGRLEYTARRSGTGWIKGPGKQS